MRRGLVDGRSVRTSPCRPRIRFRLDVPLYGCPVDHGRSRFRILSYRIEMLHF